MISLRPAVDVDRPLLLEVYAAARADELAQVPWSDEQKAAFVEQQFTAQDADYKTRRPDADFLVIDWNGQPVGRLYRAMLDEPTGPALQVIDIALLPEWRGKGIGTKLLRDILAEADAAGVPVTIHVEQFNPARRLYERLGFVEVGAGEVYVLMERKPAGHAQADSADSAS